MVWRNNGTSRSMKQCWPASMSASHIELIALLTYIVLKPKASSWNRFNIQCCVGIQTHMYTAYDILGADECKVPDCIGCIVTRTEHGTHVNVNTKFCSRTGYWWDKKKTTSVFISVSKLISVNISVNKSVVNIFIGFAAPAIDQRGN